MHTATQPGFHCPLCASPYTGWGYHLLYDCPLAAGAILHAFWAQALVLIRSGWRVLWKTTSLFVAMDTLGRELRWRLLSNEDITPNTAPNWDVASTWSGLVWQHSGPPIPTVLRRSLITSFLSTADSWILSEPPWSWTTISDPTDPLVDPSGVIGPVPILCTIQWYTPSPPEQCPNILHSHCVT